ncbi:MAG: hypothetical protein WC443_04775 [Desulfobaccales bacterium]
MGTSSARRGPTTRLWRSAKGAATRYLSPAAAGQVSVREVVARYLAAVEETPGQGEPLAAWRVTRKAGQNLGAFAEEVRDLGWEAALAARGLADAPGPPEMLAQGLSELLAGSGGGLEEAVSRTSLALVLRPEVKSKTRLDPAQLVARFLAAALFLRLALDLGEPLEAAAGGFGRLRAGFGQLREWIDAQAPGPGEPPEAPVMAGLWQGLPGWTWVTAYMTALITRLR